MLCAITRTPKIRVRVRASLAEHRRDGRQVFLQLLVARVDGERALVVDLGVLVARLVRVGVWVRVRVRVRVRVGV